MANQKHLIMNATTHEVIHLTTESFDRVTGQNKVLVDFTADWCGPCQIQGTILKDVASMAGDKAIIAKLNVDDNRTIATKYGISSIPTLLLFNNGEVISKFVGVQAKQVLVSAINNLKG
jgi:thioredoxin 1